MAAPAAARAESMKGVGMDQEERMDAMTPSREIPREPETPAALRFLGESLARQVELGIMIEQAHVSEQRAHRGTKLRLANVEAKHRRLVDANEQTQIKLDNVRSALAGGEPTEDGDVLAEARELFAKSYNLERELLEAKALIESATAQTAPWETERREWQERVATVMGFPEPTSEPLPDKEHYRQQRLAERDPELGEEYDTRPATEG